MATGEWRYGQDPERPWSDDSVPSEPAPESTPNLWGDDSDGWGTTTSWLPQDRVRPGTGGGPAQTRAGYPLAADPAPGPTPTPTPADSWRPETTRQPQLPPRPALPALPALPSADPQPVAQSTPPPAALPYASSAIPASTTPWSAFGPPPAPALPTLPARPQPRAIADRPADPPTSAPASSGRTGIDSWTPPPATTRRRITEEEDFGPRRRKDRYGEEPAYGPVFGYTAGWYGIPAVFYLIWLVTLTSEARTRAGMHFIESLPWLFAAVVLSLAVAGLLRWAIIGWRALTLSFAAAVIGAGVATIAHSLTL